jgi:hypothetical protein
MRIDVELYQADLSKLAGKLNEIKSGAGCVEVGFPEDEAHYSGMSMADLVRLLSRGFTTIPPNGGVPVDVPARPFIRQFLERRGDEIKYLVRNRFQEYLSGKTGGGMERVWADIGDEVADMMKLFAYGGEVTPGNAPYTIKRKGFDKPYVHHLDLVHSVKHWTKR